MLLPLVHDGRIFEHECKNQLNGEQSKSNKGMSREMFDYSLGKKTVSKRNQSFDGRMKHPHPPPTTQKIAFWEIFALSTHDMEIFLNEGMWCLN